jgi:hypothetical protein
MRNLKKTILGAAVLVLFTAAVPVSADLVGVWAGTGTGNCHPPGTVIYPWSVWEGKVYVSEVQNITIFEGSWEDELGNHGTFRGRVLPLSPAPDEKICIGRWTWYDPEGVSAEPVVGGQFRMVFHPEEAVCEGTWKSKWPSSSEVGTMEGQQIE